MKKIFPVIIGLITLSLIGIIYIQISWLNNMVLLREDQLRDKIGNVTKNVSVDWGGDFDAVIALINSGKADPEKIRFYIGYSGWSPGQLDTEMNEKTWLTVEAVRQLVFHPNAEEIWKDSLKHLGGEFEMMINFPIDPQLN